MLLPNRNTEDRISELAVFPVRVFSRSFSVFQIIFQMFVDSWFLRFNLKKEQNTNMFLRTAEENGGEKTLYLKQDVKSFQEVLLDSTQI